MNAPYLEGLNDAQREAVLHQDGPLMVLAGAGSGKTRVITHRIVHLIHQGVRPGNILAVTFTNKAAGEMRERVKHLVSKFPESARAGLDELPTVATFHSLCVRILREFHTYANVPKHFRIYDRSDSVRAIKQALEEAGYSPKQFEPRTILSIISRAKSDARTRIDFTADANSYTGRVGAEIWERYEKIVRDDHAFDFDDLLFVTVNLLKRERSILDTLRARFRYLHVDEYQDTNKVQYELVRLLAGEDRNICVVGDIDQNIYSWRGADIANVLQFERHFPGARVVLLEENYRSTKTIIAASNAVIQKNTKRIEKTVFTNNEAGERIALYAAWTGIDEAEYIATTARSLIRDGASPSDIAVLFRTNFQSRVLEEAFLTFDVPYQVLGTKFFERKEVKDVLSFLRLALTPGMTSDLARVINVPPRGIGKVTLLKIMEGKKDTLTGAVGAKVSAFDALVVRIGDCARTKKLSETIRYIMTETGIEQELTDSGTEDDLARLENLRELVTLSLRFDELPPEEAVSALLENAALESDQDELKEKESQDAVRLMTVHAAKGLEFPYVFVTGLEEGLFPHQRLDEHGRIDHEEERRLFYVALTRAAKKVFLTYAHTRTIFGRDQVNVPSSFLSDIGEEHLEGSGGSHASGYERTIFLD